MIPQIDIVQRLGWIGLRQVPPQWSVQQAPADVVIEAPPADIAVRTVPGDLEIDQTQAFADEDLRDPLSFAEYEAARARQAAAEGTAETARWGQRFLHIEQGDAFPAWVMRYRNRAPDVEPALVPRPFSVHIHYRPGRVEFHAEVQPVRVHAEVRPVHVAYIPGRVEVYLAQPPMLRILPPPVGRLIDAQA